MIQAPGAHPLMSPRDRLNRTSRVLVCSSLNVGMQSRLAFDQLLLVGLAMFTVALRGRLDRPPTGFDRASGFHQGCLAMVLVCPSSFAAGARGIASAVSGRWNRRANLPGNRGLRSCRRSSRRANRCSRSCRNRRPSLRGNRRSPRRMTTMRKARPEPGKRRTL